MTKLFVVISEIIGLLACALSVHDWKTQVPAHGMYLRYEQCVHCGAQRNWVKR